LRRVAVVFRGVARMGATLEDALRLAVAAYREGAPMLAAGGDGDVALAEADRTIE
jgi:hypothetical protein